MTPYETGRSYISETTYIEYIPGDDPVIVSVPHGGQLAPAPLPDRWGVVENDDHTQALARMYADAYFEMVGRRPHLVINLLDRRKLDANRGILEATGGADAAKKAWFEFQAYIGEARQWAIDTFGWGLYIDLHGHSHSHGRVELGYALSAGDLRRSDEEINRDASLLQDSSLRPLCSASGAAGGPRDPGGPEGAYDLAALIRGPNSLGAILERLGVPSVPSDVQPWPQPDWSYFSGGYNTKRHGARDGAPVGGIQIEVSRNHRRNDESMRAFAQKLAQATVTFLSDQTGYEPCRTGGEDA